MLRCRMSPRRAAGGYPGQGRQDQWRDRKRASGDEERRQRERSPARAEDEGVELMKEAAETVNEVEPPEPAQAAE